MIGIALNVPREYQERVTAELWEAATAGIAEDDERLTAFFEDDADRNALLRQFAVWEPELREEQDRDWVAESRDTWQPFAVGDRFWLVPEWRDDAPPAGRIRLTIQPGMACGTGTAPATQLCLSAMEKWLPAGASVFDVGTGSGILAEAARLLGAGTVVACDIDHEAARIARANVSGLAVFSGSVRSVRSACFDAIVANLNAATLGAIAPDLVRIRRPGGLLIVSGFRPSEAAGVAAAAESNPRGTLIDSDWACLLL
ncbi:MAG TPA: 50S ribosomal protein L11 methyltransferase [Bryobacteraceae bacterium]|nr:50S ribosomal protein L11 methyltransferase [Bryobacteraceae bacterium]